MQDKYDKAFEDMAWADMRRRLDAEMPVAGPVFRYRRLALLLILLLVLAGSGGYFWLRGAFSPLEQSTEATPAVASPAQPAEEAATREATAPEDGLRSAPAANPPADETRLAEAPRPTRPTAEGEGLVLTIPPSSTADERALPSVRQAPSARSGERFAPRADLPPRPSPRALVSAAPALPSLGLMVPGREPFDEAEDAPEGLVRPAAGHGKLDFGLRSGLLLAEPLAPRGLELEAFGELRLGRRWAVQLGLGYRLLHQAFQPPGGSNLAMDEALFPGGSNNLDNLMAVGISLTQYQVRRHQLYAPLHLAYRLSTRFSLSAGAQVMYTFSATAFDEPVMTVPSSQFNRLDAYTRQFIQAATGGTLRDDILRSWDVGLQAGIHYRLHPHWAIDLSYTFGLQDQVPADRVSLYNRFVVTGLTYRF